jgi:hypothetical protein
LASKGQIFRRFFWPKYLKNRSLAGFDLSTQVLPSGDDVTMETKLPGLNKLQNFQVVTMINFTQ